MMSTVANPAEEAVTPAPTVTGLPKVTSVVFDCGGVVLTTCRREAYNAEMLRLGERLGGVPTVSQVKALFYQSPHWAVAKLGNMATEEWFAKVIAERGVAVDDAIVAQAMETVRCTGKGVLPSTQALLVELCEMRQQGALEHVAMYSNFDLGLRALLARYGMSGDGAKVQPDGAIAPEAEALRSVSFSPLVNSAEIGIAKPTVDGFRVLLEQLGKVSTPGEVLFVDDKLTNVEAARSLGMRGIVCADTEQMVRDVRSCLGS